MAVLVLLLTLFGTALGATEISGDLQVNGKLSSGDLNAKEISSQGTIEVEDEVTTTELEANEMTTEVLYVSHITSHSGQVRIRADIHTQTLTDDSSFIQTRWTLHSHDAFEDSTDGWTAQHEACLRHSFIAGGCDSATVRKTFTLAPHQVIRVVATGHMLGMWQGEVAYLTVNGQTVWRQSGATLDSSLDVCGAGRSDARFGIPIDVVLHDSAEEVVLEFGAEIAENCQAKFAVDDVMVFVTE